MKIAIVDDEVDVADDLAGLLQDHGWAVEVYYTLDAAEVGLSGRDDPFVVVLDHNFESSDRVGYDLCRTLRSSHPYGLVLPVIYRTGKESLTDYARTQCDDLFYAPTAFVDKLDEGSTAKLLRVIQGSIERFEEMVEVLTDQSVRQAIIELSEFDPLSGETDGDTT